MGSVTFWWRVEPRCRTPDPLDKSWKESAQARVHDPLWMLARMWQLGEFHGEDSGAAVMAEVSVRSLLLDRYLLGSRSRMSPAEAQSNSKKLPNIPLEALVEAETQKKDGVNDLLRVRLGLFFESKLQSEVLRDVFREAFPVKPPEPEGGEREAWEKASDYGLSFLKAVAGKVVDGGRLVEELAGVSASEAYESVIGASLPRRDPEIRENNRLKDEYKNEMDAAGQKLISWYKELYSPPVGKESHAWKDERMEYQFSTSAPNDGKDVLLDAEQYYEGKLDWYAFTIDTTLRVQLTPETERSAQPKPKSRSFVATPAPVDFKGMPEDRWWQFEDRRFDLAHVDVTKTEIGKLLLIEFALIHSNDWFIIPIELRRGTLNEVKALKIHDTFGLIHSISPADGGSDQWTMFSLSIKPRRPGDNPFLSNMLLIPPSIPDAQESSPIENVCFLRDEMLNVVFAEERALPDELGRPISGHDLWLSGTRRARELARRKAQEAINAWHKAEEKLAQLRERNAPDAEQRDAEQEVETLGKLKVKLVNDYLEEGGDVRDLEALPSVSASGIGLARYRLARSAPANWVPFVPVQVQADGAPYVLRRFAVPDFRYIDPDTKLPARIRARGRILAPEKKPFKIHEEEIPRIGIRVIRTVQFARWTDGKSYFWIGRRKLPGRGEGSSGIRFDVLEEPKA